MPQQPSKSHVWDSAQRSCQRLSLTAIMLLLGACQSFQSQPERSALDTDLRLQEPVSEVVLEDDSTPEDLWQRVRDGLQLQDELTDANPRIEQQRLWYVSNSRAISAAAERSQPYLYFIIEQLEANDMPLELALLPIIESSYNPYAYSRSHASGLWQFIPSTGRNFNLKQTQWYDGRRDVTASTQAAISYLKRLQSMFNGDWLLALAAYNAGEGTVGRAIARNQQRGLPTDYWNLQLPGETMNYVPKLLALSELLMSPAAYGVSFTPVANEPYFEVVKLKQQVNLTKLASLSEISEDELKQLNPAFKKNITLDGPKELLIPVDKLEDFTLSLASLDKQPASAWGQYKVRSGDNLSAIANRYSLSVSSLKELNNLRSNNLRIGQTLVVPDSATNVASVAKQASPSPANQQNHKRYTVRRGDNLWQIARNHGVSVKDIQRWNPRSGKALKPGQLLTLYTR
ncbi:LysM peptidoglycan-binding domain-containing protein [Atopomonas sediminilitoris]|uniref:LysM peptidoglycan-binding domain-containing protein n=1 Tax=Atopomonas sediminilitoris TaxID=2919919 RepID=UPI001F4E5A0A|nr:LysM peptidoglycan-binding domain-containing protein [Atopomonas sediminilitoris]MCJ8168019.1 LysM peptidoglycan-binding domain-containing protein [Atopomonas sediminilitoris]